MRARDFLLIFVDLNKANIEALQSVFHDQANMQFRNNNIGQVTDYTRPVAIGSASQSYGMQDGGIDGAINYLMSTPYESMQARSQNYIDEAYYGEQPVGTSILVPSCNPRYDFLAHTPTMIVPEDVRRTRNPYLAFRALLVTVCRHNEAVMNPIKTVITSSFCTGAGCVSADEAARQMRIAYDSVFVKRIPHEWNAIWAFQKTLTDNRVIDPTKAQSIRHDDY